MYDDASSVSGSAPFPIDRRMAESLRELNRALGGADHADRLIPVADHLEAGGTLRPEAYGAYFGMVRAIQADDGQSLAPLISVIAESVRPTKAPIAVRMLGFEEFGRTGTREVRDNFGSAFLTHSQMRAIPSSACGHMTRRLRDALKLIRTRAPNAWKDVSGITTEIVATFGASRGIMTFDGCSSLERYGSILVNMRRRRTPLVLAETLVHESAHSLLFALSCNDHRVLNPPTELHKSPLRIDPRPLDGIFHAVFVLARMHGFVAEVAQHPDTSTAMRLEALKVMEQRRKNFLDGHAVLAEHARLTEIGRDLLEDAYARVQAATEATSGIHQAHH